MTDNGLHPLETLMRERIVVLDGAMGTMVQQYRLSEAEYRGGRFEDWKGKDSRVASKFCSSPNRTSSRKSIAVISTQALTSSRRTLSAARPSASTISFF